MPHRFALAALLLIAATATAAADEVIRSFDTVVRVARDGTLTVTESIVVRAENRDIKRGIYRDFPLTFRDPEGRLRQVSFKLLAVHRDGRPEPHHTARNQQGIRIYAGSENVILRPGQYAYTFRYQTGRQIRWFDGGAELFWNVTGNDWIFPIERASVRVILEDGARPLKWTAYTGRYGERGTDWRGEIEPNGELRVQTTRQLGIREGFSIVAALPPGAVTEPSELQKLYWSFLDYKSWIIAGLGFALLLAYYSFVWSAVGRDPKRGTIIPLFHAPPDISPALANYVHSWGLGKNLWRAFTAASLSLAVRKLIKFEEDGETLTLKAIRTDAPGGRDILPPGERVIFDWIKSQGGEARISAGNGTAVAKVGTDFRQTIEKENKHKFFRKNFGYFIAGLALTAGVVVAVIVFGNMRPEEYGLIFGACFVGFFVGMFAIPTVMSVASIRHETWTYKTAIKLLIFGGIVVFIFGQFFSVIIAMLGGLGGLAEIVPSLLRDYPFPFALVGGFATLNGLFFYLLRAPTDLGREVMDKLEGLHLYLDTAESARLNMNAPEITSERFEALLPYAVALDVEKPWAEAFEAALKRAYPTAENPSAFYRPSWTNSRSWSGGSIGSAVSSSSVPASSSGSSGFSSSGGGGSGGGGGGGGGGGW
jgi:uncharacterized membrane protein YgcG